MADNPFIPPKSDLNHVEAELVVPEKILKKIKNASILGLVSGGLTLIMLVFAINGANILNFSAWMLIDVVLIFGLAFGIYKKSRVCAVVILIHFAASKILIVMESGGSFTSIPIALVFLYCYAMGVVGTFQYHKYIRNQKSAALADT